MLAFDPSAEANANNITAKPSSSVTTPSSKSDV
jgi:hypothetical protein